MKRIAYTIMPYMTVIRLPVVVQNPANGFPARLLARVPPEYFAADLNEAKSIVRPMLLGD